MRRRAMRVRSGAVPIMKNSASQAATNGHHDGHPGEWGHARGGPCGLRIQQGRHMLARAAAKLAEECLTSGAYGAGNANTNDYEAHAGREGLIGEAVVDAARLGYYVGMGCTTVAVCVLCSYVSGAAWIKGLHLQEGEGVRPVKPL